MRALILAAGAALALAACGGNTETANTEANAMDANMSMDANMTMDANMMDMNMGGMDANMMANGTTDANMMAQDMMTNSPDTNLANGM
jgi:hypothetical protein